jgi:hypothetical protein
MTQVASYFGTVSVGVDKRSFNEVDRYFARLESKLQSFAKSSNAFSIPLKFNIDTARAKLSIQRDLASISRGLSLRLNNFSLNNKALTNLLNQSMSNRTGAARIRLNAALSSSALTGMREQVRRALDNLVVSPHINPRIGGTVFPGGNAAYGSRGGYGVRIPGLRGMGGFSLPMMGDPRMMAATAGIAALTGAAALAVKGMWDLGKASQVQKTRDVASRGIFENATMPDGSTRNVYGNSEAWFRGYTNRVGLDRNELTPAYQGFMASSMPTLGYEKSQKVFEAFSSFGTVRGASGESMKRALVAVQQMASKGTINAEELKGQLGDAQGFGESQILFAQAYQMMKNKTNNPLDPRLLKGSDATAELGKAMKDNKLTSSALLPIVSELMLAKARPALGAASQTGNANENRFRNAQTDFVANFAKGGGDQGMSNVWRTLADLTGEAAKNAEMFGAYFRIGTAYLSLGVAYAQDFTDLIGGDMAKGNVFANLVDPEFVATFEKVNQTMGEMGAAWKALDFSEGTRVMKEFMNSALSGLQAFLSLLRGFAAMGTFDYSGLTKALDKSEARVAGMFGSAKNALFGAPLPANVPAAASTTPLANYGATNRSSSSVININNQVTVTDKNQIGSAVDQLNQASMANSLQPFVAAMDKSAFPNSGQ